MSECIKKGCRKLKWICEDCGRVVSKAEFPMSEWISVKDKAPPSDADGYGLDVLTFSKELGINIDGYNPYRDEWNVHGKATHWMPLPEPPK